MARVCRSMTTTNRCLVCLVALLFVAGGTIAASTRLSARGEQFQGITPKPLAEVAPKSTAAANTQAQKQPKRSMLIQVLGPDERPMAGVKLHRAVWTRKPNNKGNSDYVSDERGQVRVAIPEGIYIVRLWARAKGYVPLFAGWEEEDHPETTLPAEFTFQLKPGTVIGGAVRDVEGAPIKGVAVEVMLERGGRAEGRTSPDMWLATDPGTAPITDNQGGWTLDNVPPGNDLELRLKLSHSDYISDPNWGTSQEQQGIDLKALRARTATMTMRGGLMATGTVTDAASKPIAGAVVVRGDNPCFAADNCVTIVGLNLDDDPAETRAFVEARKLPWTQAHLGGRDGDKVDILSRYAVSSIPTYILIGPDGKLIQRGGDLDEIAKVSPREPR
jgi:hypothetical protein